MEHCTKCTAVLCICLEKVKKKLCTWANFWTVVSLGLGLLAYKISGNWLGDASMVTGTIAFLVGLA